MNVISAMQACKLVPEAYLVEPGCDLPAVVQNALEDGIHMFIVYGGDGTIDVMAGALAGTNDTLGIIPTGTQNNVALSLEIPADIPAAIAMAGGLIPLASYMLISNAGSALMFSVVFTLVALLIFGYVKGRFTI